MLLEYTSTINVIRAYYDTLQVLLSVISVIRAYYDTLQVLLSVIRVY